MSIEVRGLEDVQRMLQTLRDESPKAALRAQNKITRALWEGERLQAVADFDRPKQYTISSILYEQATRENGISRVYVKDQELSVGAGADHYLGVQTLGGTRHRLRKSERIFQDRGLMPRGYVWVPTRHTKLDRNGNVPGALLSAILGLGRNKGKVFDKYVVLGPKGGEWGVWEMQPDGRQLKILKFMTPRTYRARYDFYGRAEREIAANLTAIMSEEIDKAIREAGG